MTTYNITVIPQLVIRKSILDFNQLMPVGIPHPTNPRLIIIPKEVDLTNGAESLVAPEPMLSWLKNRFGPDAPTESFKILADPDKDGRTQFEEYACGSDPAAAEFMQPAITFSSLTGNMAIEHARNGAETGIVHQIQVGDGKADWRDALEGTDFVALDLTGTGMTEYVEAWGLNNRKTRVLKNLHPMYAKPLAFIRLKLTQTITL